MVLQGDHTAALEIAIAQPDSSVAVGVAAFGEAGENSNGIAGRRNQWPRRRRDFRVTLCKNDRRRNHGESRDSEQQNPGRESFGRLNGSRSGLKRGYLGNGGERFRKFDRGVRIGRMAIGHIRAPGFVWLPGTLFIDKARRVLALRDYDLHRVAGAFVQVVFVQPFAKAMELDANDGIALGVELGRPAERIDGDAVFLNLIGSAVEVLGTDIAEKLRQGG